MVRSAINRAMRERTLMTHAPTLSTGSAAAAHGHVAERGSDGFVRKMGREFLLAIYGALRTVKMYPPDNPVVQKTMQEVVRLSNELLRNEREVELRVSGEFIFVNATRLRLDLDNYASFSRIICRCSGAGVGLCRMRERVRRRDWLVFLSLLQNAGRGRHRRSGSMRSARSSPRRKVTAFELGPPHECR